MAVTDWPCTRQVASSHSARAAAGVAPEFFLFVLFFDFRRRDGLRKGQRLGVAVVGLAWPRFCMSILDSSTSRLLRLM
jgi:hypothetical protein